MLATIGAVIGGLFAAIAGLFAAILGLGLGLAAMAAILGPLLLILLIPLIPVMLVVILLRKLGFVRGRFATFLAFLICVALLIAGANYYWSRGVTSAQNWLDDNREMLEACAAQDGATITLEFNDGTPYFTCNLRKKRGTSDDTHI